MKRDRLFQKEFTIFDGKLIDIISIDGIILSGTFDVSVSLRSLRREVDNMKTKNFIIKVLRLIAIIILSSTLLVLAIKK